MVTSANLGFPRIGADRELKRLQESYWRGRITRDALVAGAQELRERQWREQAAAGIDHIPSNDFSFYDHVLDTIALLGAVPPRFGWKGGVVDLDTYFAMARGVQEKDVSAGGAEAGGAAALEMTKWYDTNYHYLVPELGADQRFSLGSTAPIDAFLAAKSLGIHTRPVLLGPVSFLLLSKSTGSEGRPIELLDRILPIYAELLERLAAAGAEWVQIDEPHLVCDLDGEARQAFARAYRVLSGVGGLKLMLTSYFGGLQDNLRLATALPVAGLHIDLARAPGQLDEVLASLPADFHLSLGLVDGRNVWRADLDVALALARRAVASLGAERVSVAPSCSLLHVPVDVERETALDAEARGWLAFALQKLQEVQALTDALNDATPPGELFRASRAAAESRRASPRVTVAAVQQRLAAVVPDDLRRRSPFARRKEAQQARLGLPALPTTTIGSFPQTPEVRKARASYLKGEITAQEYDGFLAREIDSAIRFQEEIGLDVLVHGEAERSDMVEYFGECLDGFLFTRHGWVQSYGSRCVRPPIIYGDVTRARPMTVRWSAYAQSRTDRPMKGMLTGPVTILQWSFVRDDQPRSATCRQIALAIRDEVDDLVAAGLPVVQIDEPAVREGLPLRRADRGAYLAWAVDSFRLASSSVADDVQIHTHMCYAEFEEILAAIVAMDADVISIESSRSKMELLASFGEHAYPADIGPGVYDIHSPHVPTEEEMVELLERALGVLSPGQLWVNPDCGLKTRRWEEVEPALRNLVAAAATVRARLEVRPG